MMRLAELKEEVSKLEAARAALVGGGGRRTARPRQLQRARPALGRPASGPPAGAARR